MEQVCTTAVIPFGSADDFLFGPPPHFQGSIGFADGRDYSAITAAHGTLSDPTALSTDDTTTYATADVAGFDAEMKATYSDFTADWVFLSIKGRQDYALDIIAGATITARLILVARRGWEQDFQLTLYGYDAAQVATVNLPKFVDVTADGWVRYEADLIDLPAQVEAFRVALAARQQTLLVSPSWASDVAPASFDVAYMALEVTYCVPVASPSTSERLRRPVLRQMHRGGSGGIGGVPRLIANPTQRDGLRRGPSGIV